MTLTLDEVRRIRFPMARRPNEGYRAGEVDDFVDKVDATFSQMVDETDRLKKQLQALRDNPPVAAPAAPAGPSEEELALRAAEQQLRADNARLQAELEELRNRPVPTPEPVHHEGDDERNQEIAQLRQATGELQARNEHLSGQLAQARTELDQARGEAESARHEAQSARDAAAQQTFTAPVQGGATFERVVVSTSPEASAAVVRLVQIATEQAESVVAEAEGEAHRRVREAEAQANETTQAAQARAEQIESEAKQHADEVTRGAQEHAAELTRGAQQHAEEVTRGAQDKADALTAAAQENHDRVYTDAVARREELFSHLEAERETFASKIDELKAFENDYRTSLTNHLRGQVEALEGGRLQPEGSPVLLSDRQQSATPRLDALLAERH